MVSSFDINGQNNNPSTVIGAAGDDTFVFHAGDGNDTILDFGEGGRIVFEGPEFDLSEMEIKSCGDDAIIKFGGDKGVSVTVKGASAEGLNTALNNDVTSTNDDSDGYSVSSGGDDTITVTFNDN